MKREIPNDIIFEWALGVHGTVSFRNNKITIQTNEPFGKIVGDILHENGFHQRGQMPNVYVTSYTPIKHAAVKRIFA